MHTAELKFRFIAVALLLAFNIVVRFLQSKSRN